MEETCKLKMMKDLSKIVSNAYDFEWWFIARNRTMKFFYKNQEWTPECDFRGAHRFPTTKDSLEKFLRGKKQVERANRKDSVVDNLGK
jgi:hypothetical protein